MDTCKWGDFFDEADKRSLDVGYFTIGFISVALGIWLNMSIMLTNLRLDRNYRLLANFTATACIRRTATLMAQLPLGHMIIGLTEFQPFFCNTFAFLETFFAVYEVEWLTHICIDRYVLAKYVSNGWAINKSHHRLYKRLCILFASLYSFLPLFGIGKYGLDFSCTYCTYDMVLPDSWQKYLVALIFFLRSIKPAAFMTIMLFWSYALERKLKQNVENCKRRIFTRNVHIVAWLNQCCWAPIAVNRGFVVMYQLLYSQIVIPPSVNYVKWALWIHWAAPAFTAAALFVFDKDIRNRMLLKYNGSKDEAKRVDHIDQSAKKEK